MEHILIVAYEEPSNGDTAYLTVCRQASGNRIFGINGFYGTEPMQLYRKLTVREGMSNMVAIGTVTENDHRLENLLQRGHAEILHNQECPYGHKCMASDCMECMEIYEKVDGLDTESADKVKAVRKDV